MTSAKNFHDLQVWQKAHKFVLNIYSITKNFPAEEKYGLTSQLRRAAVSAPSNIVEGFKRQGVKDSLHFYTIAEASLEESRYQILLARDLQYLTTEIHAKLENQAEEISKMLYAFKKSH
jgi:four helix bundle protein